MPNRPLTGHTLPAQGRSCRRSSPTFEVCPVPAVPTRPAALNLPDARPIGSVVVKAVRRFTVRAGLPEALAELGTLATNLRWTWHPPTQELFAAIDPATWDRIGNPLRLLAEVPAHRLEQLATDPEFLDRVNELSEDLRRYLTDDRLVPAPPGRARRPRARGQRPRRPDAGLDRVLLHGVRRHRGAAQLLRRARRARRRPPEGGLRPRRAADRRRPAVPVGLLPPVAVAGRLAGRALPGASTRAGCRSTRSWSPRARRSWCTWRCPAAGCCAPGSGRRRSAGCPCCCSTPTWTATTTTCAGSPTGSTAATRTTASARRSWPASAACARCGRTAS